MRARTLWVLSLLVACEVKRTQVPRPLRPAADAVAAWFAGDAAPDDADRRKRKKKEKNRDREPKETLAFRKAETFAAQSVASPVVVAEPADDGEMLEALGYVAGVEEAAADRVDGVQVHDRAAVSPGYTLYTPGGHSLALLLDEDGREVHRWSKDLREIWPDFDPSNALETDAISWRRAQLLPGGDLVVMWSGFGMARLTADSRVRWASYLPVHHDFEVLADGSVVVLTRAPREAPDVWKKGPIMEDFVTWLDPQGRRVREVSLLTAFQKHPEWDAVWRRRPKKKGDIFHTNTLQVIPDDASSEHPAFRRGAIVTSMRHLDAVAVFDPEQEAITWWMKDAFSRQHDPQLLSNGHLLVYDNHGLGEASRMLEFDVTDRSLVWSYEGTEEQPFFSGTCGHAQRLANGNTLVNESTAGRGFEVTPDGRVVWELRTAFRTGEGLRYVSRIYELARIPPAELAWLPAR